MPALTVLAIVGHRRDVPPLGPDAGHRPRPRCAAPRSARWPARSRSSPSATSPTATSWTRSRCSSSPASWACRCSSRRSGAPARRWRRLPWVGLGVLAVVGLVGQPLPRAALPAALQPQREGRPHRRRSSTPGTTSGSRSGSTRRSRSWRSTSSRPSTSRAARSPSSATATAMYLSDGLDLNAVKFTPWNADRAHRGGRALPARGRLPDPAGRHPPPALLDAQRRGRRPALRRVARRGRGAGSTTAGRARRYPSRTWYLPPGETAHDGPRRRPAHELRAGVPRRPALLREPLPARPNDATIDLGVDTLDDPRARGRLHRHPRAAARSGPACARSCGREAAER